MCRCIRIQFRHIQSVSIFACVPLRVHTRLCMRPRIQLYGQTLCWVDGDEAFHLIHSSSSSLIHRHHHFLVFSFSPLLVFLNQIKTKKSIFSVSCGDQFVFPWNRIECIKENKWFLMFKIWKNYSRDEERLGLEDLRGIWSSNFYENESGGKIVKIKK